MLHSDLHYHPHRIQIVLELSDGDFVFCEQFVTLVNEHTHVIRYLIMSDEAQFEFSSIQWVPGALSLGIKQPGREADHSPPPSAEVKECVELYLHASMPSWRGAQLKHRDNFTFTWMCEYTKHAVLE
jgi:hypothetical protein